MLFPQNSAIPYRMRNTHKTLPLFASPCMFVAAVCVLVVAVASVLLLLLCAMAACVAVWAAVSGACAVLTLPLVLVPAVGNFAHELYIVNNYGTGMCAITREVDVPAVVCTTSCDACVQGSGSNPSCAGLSQVYQAGNASACTLLPSKGSHPQGTTWTPANAAACAAVPLISEVACTDGTDGCCGSCCSAWCSHQSCSGSGTSRSCSTYTSCCAWTCCSTTTPQACTETCVVDHTDEMWTQLEVAGGALYEAQLSVDAGGTLALAEAWFAQYDPGTKHTCYYDPAAPATTLMLAPPTYDSFLLAVFILACVAGGGALLCALGLAVWALAPRVRERARQWRPRLHVEDTQTHKHGVKVIEL